MPWLSCTGAAVLHHRGMAVIARLAYRNGKLWTASAEELAQLAGVPDLWTQRRYERLPVVGVDCPDSSGVYGAERP